MKWGYLAAAGIVMLIAGIGGCESAKETQFYHFIPPGLGFAMIFAAIWGRIEQENGRYDKWGNPR